MLSQRIGIPWEGERECNEQSATRDSASRSVGKIVDKVCGANATFIFRETNGGYEDGLGSRVASHW